MPRASAMPNDGKIQCPSCKFRFPLSETMTAEVAEQLREELQAEHTSNLARVREAERRDASRLAEEKIAERTKDAIDERRAAENKSAALVASLEQKEKLLAEAQREQARLTAKEREIDERTRELDLTIARQVNSKAAEIRDEERRKADEAAKLQIGEKDVQLQSLNLTIEELKRKMEQGDNRVAGEAQELVLETALRSAFPSDRIEPVAKGKFGGDVLQTALDSSGRTAGSILWESKRTKTWEGGWLPKLRADQRAAAADISVIVTQAMPKGMTEAFGLVEGVWVCNWRMAIPLVAALRQQLLALAEVRASREGMETKAEQLYTYMTGTAFRQKVEAMVEQVTALQASLTKERAALTAIWAERDKRIYVLGTTVAAMFGEVAGISGGEVKQIEGLEL